MVKFEVTITETLEKVIEVEAKNGFEAVDIVQNRYDRSDIILDSGDFVGVDFTVKGPLIRE